MTDTGAPPPAEAPSGRSWKMRLALLVTPHVFGTVNLAAVAAMAPIIKQDLDLTLAEIGLLSTAYTVCQAVAGKALGPPVFGLIADQFAYGSAWLMTGIGVLVAGVVLARFFREQPQEA